MKDQFYMKLELGDKGLEDSWQQKFSPIVDCVHCQSPSRIAFTAIEDGDNWAERAYVTHLYDNELAIGGAFWPHDCCAFAIYLCTKCAKATALYNQA